MFLFPKDFPWWTRFLHFVIRPSRLGSIRRCCEHSFCSRRCLSRSNVQIRDTANNSDSRELERYCACFIFLYLVFVYRNEIRRLSWSIVSVKFQRNLEIFIVTGYLYLRVRRRLLLAFIVVKRLISARVCGKCDLCNTYLQTSLLAGHIFLFLL